MDTLRTDTKYNQLAEILKARLQALPPQGRLPSVRSLMKRFNVSQHTVTSALRLLENKGLISRRQGSGTYLRESKMAPTIAYCRPQSPSAELEFRENILQSACDVRGWKLHVHRFDPAQAGLFAEEIHADAFVLQPELVTFHSPLLSHLVAKNIPRVAMGRDTGGINLDFVIGDDASMLGELMGGLLERGHRRIAFLISEPPFYEVQERVKFFKHLGQILKLDFTAVLDADVKYGCDALAQSAEFLKAYLGSLPTRQLPFTALIACSSPGSIAARRILHEAGFQVPRDCSLCCMGSDATAQYAVPSITNASPCHVELAEACLRILDQRLQGSQAPLLCESVTYRANWRESTGKVTGPSVDEI